MCLWWCLFLSVFVLTFGSPCERNPPHTVQSLVAESQVVFTGKVSSEVKNNKYLVNIKRVMKGELSDDIAYVKTSKCERNWIGSGRTGVFFANISDEDKLQNYKVLRLVGRPLPINLKSIRQLDTVNKDITYKPRLPISEELCEKTYCKYGADCITKGDGSVHCECPKICPTTYTPVCASDANTYNNECAMRKTSCERKETLRVQYNGECEKPDPCRDVKCQYGARCVPSVDGMSAKCECPTHCSAYGDHINSEPVCGTDGTDYDDICELKRTACTNSKNVTVKYNGLCDPCSSISCTEPQVCQLDDERNPVCRCGESCSMEFTPVCGSDGKTYSNECVLRQESCRSRKDLRIIYLGKCDSGINPCMSVKCEWGEECVISKYGTAQCECPPVCEPVMSPVCGDDGHTYESLCELYQMSCVKKISVHLAYTGPCGGAGPCSVHVCKHGGVCIERDGQATCQCPICSTEFSPVCGSDGVSYSNECKLQHEACHQNKDINVLYNGYCNGCENISCDYYGICETDDKGNTNCVCPNNCDEVEDLVCGTDGITYRNQCQLEIAACTSKQFIMVAYRGHCDLCKDVTCKYGARCEAGHCVCPTNCTGDLSDPVCSSNMVTYVNECELERASCLQPKGSSPLTILFYGDCNEKGLSDEANQKNCEQSVYGCCPDGKTPAIGPDSTGCGSECGCNRLGSYSNKCDPLTSQCTCRPGVAGLKCDRCEPGYWGLLKIVDGNEGCVPCECSMFGSERDDCEQMTGRCMCKPGVQGQKCTMCTESNMVLRPSGCVPADMTTLPPTSCSDLSCYFGAVCEEHNGIAKCECHLNCTERLEQIQAICGSDGRTYGSECQMKLHACKYQIDIIAKHLGACNELSDSPFSRSNIHGYGIQDDVSSPQYKSTRHLFIPQQDHRYYYSSMKEETNSLMSASLHHSGVRRNFGKDVYYAAAGYRPTPATIKVVTALIGDLCIVEDDCGVRYSHCVNGACTCKEGFMERPDRQECVESTPPVEPTEHIGACSSSPCQTGSTCEDTAQGSFKCICAPLWTGVLCSQPLKLKGYNIPSFDQYSYIRLKRLKAYNKLSIEVEFMTYGNDGIILYNQQNPDGRGDFVSLAIINGFVEFRYNLGNGPVVITSLEKIELKKFHKVVIKRYNRDGILKLDEYEDVGGQSQGTLKALDLVEDAFIGYVPTNISRVFQNIGTAKGLTGCIRKFKIGGHTVELHEGHDVMVEEVSGIGECGQSPCSNLPCKNSGTCYATDSQNFKCVCTVDFTGDHCENRLDPCLSNPCTFGSTCDVLPHGSYICKCPPGRKGTTCEEFDVAVNKISVPEFHGKSFLEFPRLDNMGRAFSLEIWFLSRKHDGVLLYNGQLTDGKGDFISLNLVNGHVQFKFDLGSGAANLTTSELITINEWHAVRITRLNKDATIRLDNGEIVFGSSVPPLNELNLELPLYIGGVPSSKEVSSEAGIKTGLVGAIQRIIVNGHSWVNLAEHMDIISQRQVTVYEGEPCSVHSNPCVNGGICQPVLSTYNCKCSVQYSGKHCEQFLDMDDSDRAVRFDGNTFYSYPNKVYKRRKEERVNKYEMRFRTTEQNGLLLWLSKGKRLKNNYLAIAIVNGFTELKFNLGKRLTYLTLQSKIHVSDGAWHTLLVYRRKRQAMIKVDSETPVRGIAQHGSTLLNTDGILWIGGTTISVLPSGLPTAYYSGFKGCIQNVRVSKKSLNMLKRLKNNKSVMHFCHDNDV